MTPSDMQTLQYAASTPFSPLNLWPSSSSSPKLRIKYVVNTAKQRIGEKGEAWLRHKEDDIEWDYLEGDFIYGHISRSLSNAVINRNAVLVNPGQVQAIARNSRFGMADQSADKSGNAVA